MLKHLALTLLATFSLSPAVAAEAPKADVLVVVDSCCGSYAEAPLQVAMTKAIRALGYTVNAVPISQGFDSSNYNDADESDRQRVTDLTEGQGDPLVVLAMVTDTREMADVRLLFAVLSSNQADLNVIVTDKAGNVLARVEATGNGQAANDSDAFKAAGGDAIKNALAKLSDVLPRK
ncbi:MAG TPA: hypothetical protein VHN99_01085 [Deinococcales bacterium]|nr:hypothetical protein [Deinococcales bacterium]